MGLLETTFYIALVALMTWPVFQALLVFPLVVMIYRAVATRRRGDTLSVEDLKPSAGKVRSLVNNLGLALLNGFFWATVLTALYAAIDVFWTETVGIDRFAAIDRLPVWLQVICLLIIFDFVNYWSHRLLHRPWMWAIHSLHHSDAHMNFTTSHRVHVLELLQMSLVSLIFIGWLDFPTASVAMAVTVRAWYGLYVHADLPFDHGRLRKIFASPNYHQWHHADDPAIYGKNLCDMFPVWDILFGTHHDPGRCNVPLGVSDAPEDMIRGQIYPIVYYARLWRDASSRRRDVQSASTNVSSGQPI